MSSPLAQAQPGPRVLTGQTQAKTENPSDLRVGSVSQVTAQGVGVDISEGTVFAAHLDSYSPAVGDSVAMMKTQDSWVVMGRLIGSGTRARGDVTGPGPAITGSTLAAVVFNGSGATLATSSGSTVDVTKTFLDYYHPPGHHVLLSVGLFWTGSAAATGAIFDFWENTTPVVFGQTIVFPVSVAAAVGTNRWFNASFVLDAARFGGAARNLNIAMTAASGTGTATVVDASNRGFMIVQDLGDASFIPVV